MCWGVTEYVAKYASKEAADDAGAKDDDTDSMSSVGSFEDEEDEEPAGQMEEVWDVKPLIAHLTQPRQIREILEVDFFKHSV